MSCQFLGDLRALSKIKNNPAQCLGIWFGQVAMRGQSAKTDLDRLCGRFANDLYKGPINVWIGHRVAFSKETCLLDQQC